MKGILLIETSSRISKRISCCIFAGVDQVVERQTLVPEVLCSIPGDEDSNFSGKRNVFQIIIVPLSIKQV